MDMTPLVTRLEAARRTYYQNTGELVITDAEYDALEDQLRALDPNHPVLTKVGAAPSSGGGAWIEVKHTIPMGSLNKAQNLTDLDSWLASCTRPASSLLVVSDKCDGASCGLKYLHRKFHQALTRGDGITGQDITRNVALMQGVIKILPPTMPDGTPTPDDVYIRGEIIVKKSDFVAHFPGESNPRNTASGTSKRQSDNSKCQYLTFMAYQMMPNGVGMATKGAELQALQTAGFFVPRWVTVQGTNTSTVESVYQVYIKTIRASLDYEIDGLVIDLDDRDVREGLGDLNGRPRGSDAYKFPHEKKPTILIDVEWQVGNSGRITPVAVFVPVILGGRSIERASLATVRQCEMLKLHKGCTVLVSTRNDCIPRVEANLSEGIENV